MPLIELNVNPTDRQLRQFAGLVIPLLAVLCATVLWWRSSGGTASVWILILLSAAGLFALGGSLRPALARPIYVGWMYAAYPIGWVIGHVVIGVVFFLVLTPIALVMRACGRDPLQRKFDATRASYWEKRSPQEGRAQSQPPSQAPTPAQEDGAGRYFRQF
ncbi:MAG: SxtJ family membrane protein [Pirellulaceae bacterium]